MSNNRHILEVEKRVHIHMFILFAKIRPYHKIENVKNPTTEQIPHGKHAKIKTAPRNLTKIFGELIAQHYLRQKSLIFW